MAEEIATGASEAVDPAAVSAADGSVGPVRDRVTGLPSFTAAGASKVAVGATFVTAMLAEGGPV